MQRRSCVIAPLALVSNGTRRITGSGADGLLSEDEKNGAQGGVRGLWGGMECELQPLPDPKRAHRRGTCAVVRGPVRHLRRLRGGRL